MPLTVGSKVLVQRDRFDLFMAALAADGRQVVGPTVADGAVVYDTVETSADLPVGRIDEQEGGHYRLSAPQGEALFGYALGVQGWKRQLFPAKQHIWSAERGGAGFRISASDDKTPSYAFLGVRACELAAIQVQDKVFDNGQFAEPGYLGRRRDALIVAVQCGRAVKTCFCATAGTGPKVGAGYDLLLSELTDHGRHAFLVEIGSERGAAVLATVPHEEPSASDMHAAEALPRHAEAQQVRKLDGEAAALLKDNVESSHWDEVAKRCLTCGNCTQVCPTCFCSTMEDTTDLTAARTDRWRRWDSCFTIDYSYIHGGSVRREGGSRYRQWITHKLAYWHDQFGSSGCVGCGRCITWCPVGIDITAEVGALRANKKGG